MAETIDDLIDEWDRIKRLKAEVIEFGNCSTQGVAILDHEAYVHAKLAAVLPRDGWHAHTSGRRYRVVDMHGLGPRIVVRDRGDDRP